MWLDDTQPIDAALTRVRSHEQPNQQTESWFATTLIQTGSKPSFRFWALGRRRGRESSCAKQELSTDIPRPATPTSSPFTARGRTPCGSDRAQGYDNGLMTFIFLFIKQSILLCIRQKAAQAPLIGTNRH